MFDLNMSDCGPVLISSCSWIIPWREGEWGAGREKERERERDESIQADTCASHTQLQTKVLKHITCKVYPGNAEASVIED